MRQQSPFVPSIMAEKMVEFQIDNRHDILADRSEWAMHTATGYECAVKLPGDIPCGVDSSQCSRTIFFIRHMVDFGGNPYIEFGFSGFERFEKGGLLKHTKDVLAEARIEQVESLQSDVDCFCEDKSAADEIRLKANVSGGISEIVNTLETLLPFSAVEFITEQEKVEDVLYKSLLAALGTDLKYGHDEAYAQSRARQLATCFIIGFGSGESKIAIANQF